MKRKVLSTAIALAVATVSGRIKASTTYSIQRIGVAAPTNQIGANAVTGNPIEQEGIFYGDSSGAVVGSTTQYNGTDGSSGSFNFYWVYNPTSATSSEIGLTSALYQKSTFGNAVNESISTAKYQTYSKGYVAGTSQRFSSGNSLGVDAWIYSSSSNTTSAAIPVPTVPTQSAVPGANVYYIYNDTNPVGTYESMGSDQIFTGSNGDAAGSVRFYASNSGAAQSTISDDVWYYNGTNTNVIGLVDGTNVRTVGNSTSSPLSRTNTLVRLNNTGMVLGFAKYYGGETTSSNTGYDLWVYNPSNPTGTGANGTTAISGPSTSPITGDVYAGNGVSTSGFSSTALLTNSGIVAASFQLFASTDTARSYIQGFDAYQYRVATGAYTQVGLTAAINGSQYTYYPSTTVGAAGVGGTTMSSIGSALPYNLPLSESGQEVGITRRTNPGASGAGVSAGQDAWVYYPSTAVPSGAVAGTTQVGLTGGVYEANAGTAGLPNNTRSSTSVNLMSNGGVVGNSSRYASSTSTSTVGSDVYDYDPAHGITTSKLIGLTGSNYEYVPNGATNTYRSASITATGTNGMVGGYTLRQPHPFSSGSTITSTYGQDAWVYDPSTNVTYNIDPTDANFAAGTLFASTAAYISDNGVVLGWDTNTTAGASMTGTQSAPYYYRLFKWSLSYDSGDGLYDTPNFQYLDTAVDPASFSAGNWQSLDNSTTYFPAITAAGNIVGDGSLNNEDGTNYVPFLLTPSSAVPEPSSLGMIAIGATLALRRRRQL